MPRPLPNPSAKRSRAGSKRRAAGWMLLTLGVVVAGVWYWSGSRPITIFERDSTLGICRCGTILVMHPDRLMLDYEGALRPSDRPRWIWSWFEYRSLFNFPSINSYVIAPLWPFSLLFWTTGGLALWSGRRARRRALEGHCPTCGYNLAGLGTDSPCPECGRSTLQ